MTVYYAMFTIAFLRDSSSWWQSLLILVLAPLLAPIAIPLATVGYIVWVAYSNARKVVQPGYYDFMVGVFKMFEGILEANFQAILGLSTLRFATCFE